MTEQQTLPMSPADDISVDWSGRLLTVLDYAGAHGLTTAEAAYAWDTSIAIVTETIEELVRSDRVTDSGARREGSPVWVLTRDSDELQRESERRTREGIARVDRNASEEWKSAADGVIQRLAETRKAFTADDVWWGLEAAVINSPREPRALGARLQVAARKGLIVNESPPVKSQRPETHGSWIAQWTSLVRRGAAS